MSRGFRVREPRVGFMVGAEALRQFHGSIHIGRDDIGANPASDAGIGLAIADGVGVHGHHCMAFSVLSIPILLKEIDTCIMDHGE